MPNYNRNWRDSHSEQNWDENDNRYSRKNRNYEVIENDPDNEGFNRHRQGYSTSGNYPTNYPGTPVKNYDSVYNQRNQYGHNRNYENGYDYYAPQYVNQGYGRSHRLNEENANYEPVRNYTTNGFVNDYGHEPSYNMERYGTRGSYGSPEFVNQNFDSFDTMGRYRNEDYLYPNYSEPFSDMDRNYDYDNRGYNTRRYVGTTNHDHPYNYPTSRKYSKRQVMDMWNPKDREESWSEEVDHRRRRRMEMLPNE